MKLRYTVGMTKGGIPLTDTTKRSARRAADGLSGNTSTGILKVLALVFMFCDHAGKMCYPTVPELRIIGRLAFPLYCWCLVVGACHTRSMPRYILRLALVGLISQPLYMVALDHPWEVPNIFLTLLLGLIGIWGIREKLCFSHIWAPLLAMAAAIDLNCGAASYGWKGVLLMMLLYCARGRRTGIAAVMIAFCLYWGNGSSSVTTAFGYPLYQLSLRTNPYNALVTPWLKLQAMAVLALPLMIWPDTVSFRLPDFLQVSDIPGGSPRIRARGTLGRILTPFRRAQELAVSAVPMGDAPDTIGVPRHVHRVRIPTRMPAIRLPAWLGYSLYPLHLAGLIALQYHMGLPIHWEHLVDKWPVLAQFF